MDNIGITNKHYKKISNISIGIMFVILEAYLMLILSGIDLFNFSMIKDVFIQYVLQVIVQLGLFATMYTIIYNFVKLIYCEIWKRKNKNCWVKGIWLHIHVKNEIRVGMIEIKQNFNTINAEGHNITPKQKNNYLMRQTTWSYFLGKVVDDQTARDFIGCYSAQDVTNQSSKDGIHTLKISMNSSGYANKMEGGFRDTFKVNATGLEDIGNHAGQLFFFKLSKKCKKYLIDKNGFRYDLLFDLHENESFFDEPYVKKLKEVLD